MNKPLKRNLIIIFNAFIILGVFALALNMIFGDGTVTFVESFELNGYTMYKYDLWGYINNIQSNVQNVAQLKLEAPTKQWITEMDISNWYIVIGNNLAVMYNYITMGVSTILYPVRVGSYALRTYLTIIGIDFMKPTEGIKWLIDTINSLITLQIPYIP